MHLAKQIWTLALSILCLQPETSAHIFHGALPLQMHMIAAPTHNIPVNTAATYGARPHQVDVGAVYGVPHQQLHDSVAYGRPHQEIDTAYSVPEQTQNAVAYGEAQTAQEHGVMYGAPQHDGGSYGNYNKHGGFLRVSPAVVSFKQPVHGVAQVQPAYVVEKGGNKNGWKESQQSYGGNIGGWRDTGVEQTYGSSKLSGWKDSEAQKSSGWKEPVVNSYGLSVGSSFGNNGARGNHGGSYGASSGNSGSSYGSSAGGTVTSYGHGAAQSGGHDEEHGHHEHEKHEPMPYEFEYFVSDPHTHDVKNQKESSDGHVVKGQYSLVQPDGKLRTVEYIADWKHGFQAKVHYSEAPHIDEHGQSMSGINFNLGPAHQQH